ncbi:MAG: hypothetical protein H6609_17170 [Ignavibacteriales bacterium]|nr:hypothetical protein [Ignavibacteriales bacterium]
MRLNFQIILVVIIFIGCSKVVENQNYFQNYIGKSVSDILIDDSLNIAEYSFINEPPGIGRGLISNLLNGQQIYIYVDRNDAIIDTTFSWKVEDFNKKLISGIAIKRANSWQIFGNVIKYYHN